MQKELKGGGSKVDQKYMHLCNAYLTFAIHSEKLLCFCNLKNHIPEKNFFFDQKKDKRTFKNREDISHAKKDLERINHMQNET